MTYPDTELFINGHWIAGSGDRTVDVFDPATGTVIGRVCVAEQDQLEAAAGAAGAAFEIWRDTSVLKRANVLRRVGQASPRSRCSIPTRIPLPI